jgi:hypothetical protein
MDVRSFPDARLKMTSMAAIIFLLIGAGFFVFQRANAAPVSPQPAAGCVQLSDPREIPGPKIITFDTLADKTTLGTQYSASHGVSFSGNSPAAVVHAVTGKEAAQTNPNVALHPTGGQLPFVINFSFPRTHAGFYLGNGGQYVTGAPVIASISVKNVAGGSLCSFRVSVSKLAHDTFFGVYDSTGQISSISIFYGGGLSESIDNLYVAPGANYAGRKPLPKWTQVPTVAPTKGPSPTPTSVLPIFPISAAKFPISKVPSITPPDFGIFKIEITQAIQCFNGQLGGCADNSLPFVLSKSTVARVYIQGRNSHSYYNNVPVRLHIHAFGNDYVMNAGGNARASIDQSKHDAAEFYFLAYSGNTSNIQVWAEVDPDHIYNPTYTNNRFPTVGSTTYSFANRKTILVAGERLNYHPAGYAGTRQASGWAVNGGAAQWWNQVLPVSDNGINYFVRSGYLDWTTSLGSGDGQHALISTLNLMWIKENALSFWFGTGPFTGVRHVYGWAPSQGYSGGHADMPIYPHAGGLGVVGIGSDAPGTNTDNPGSGALIFGHELTHDYNIFHTNTSDGCGSNDSNTLFPYSSASIQVYGFNTITGKIYTPSQSQDLMSYCPSGGSKQGWISPYTWSTMYGDLGVASLAVAPAGAAPSLANQAQVVYTQSLVVNAVINHPLPASPTTYTGNMGTLLRVNNTGPMPAITPGDFTIEQYSASGASGTLLYSQSFKVDFKSEYAAASGPLPQPPFSSNETAVQNVSFIIPYADATRSIALTHLGKVMEVREVSLNAPQVTITSPVTAANWNAGETHALTWTGSDPDGGTLNYSVFYSNDGGTSYSLVADNLTALSYNVVVNSMAGGSDVRFRVVASDGVNTGFDETPAALTIPNQPPVATISDPIGASIHRPGDLIVFHGIGTDMEDGTLPPAALQWSDNLQGGLGIGQTVPINNLTPGTHVITLTVTDSYNISRTSTVTIDIAYPLYLPSLMH